MSQPPEAIELDGAKAMIYRNAPSWDGQRTAAIGKIDLPSLESGTALLNQVIEQLKREEFSAVLGPMDGDTWHAYRLVVESDGSPPFLMEPTSGTNDLDAFKASAFEPISHYISTRAPLEETLGEEAVNKPGITVTSWDGKNPETLVDKLFQMSRAAFDGNAFFKPIDTKAFVELYQPILPMIDPRHVLFAHQDEGKLVGFLFGMPDRLEGSSPNTAILKTYASGLRGVGHLLADHYHRSVLAMGFTDIVHALMHQDNVSLERSRQHKAKVFRRYALMGRQL